MGWFDSHEDTYSQYQEAPKHEAHLSHELIAGAAAYEAAKAYEQHRAANGNPDSHAKAKELIAGFAGAFIDREVETRGLDFIDSQRAKQQARKHVEETYTETDYYQSG